MNFHGRRQIVNLQNDLLGFIDKNLEIDFTLYSKASRMLKKYQRSGIGQDNHFSNQTHITFTYSNALGSCNPIHAFFQRKWWWRAQDNNKSLLLHAEEMMGKCLWMRKSQWFSAENKTVSMHPTSHCCESGIFVQKLIFLNISSHQKKCGNLFDPKLNLQNSKI